MKQFIAFAYRRYYPEGGMNDCIGDFDTQEQAEKAVMDALNSLYDNNDTYADLNEFIEENALGHIFDTHSKTIVWEIPDFEMIE